MQRVDVIREISIHCRRRHEIALLACGLLVLEQDTEHLEILLEALREALAASPQGISHLTAYAERWGRLPDPK